MPVDAAFVEIDGPWQHRYVAANGARFHIKSASKAGTLVEIAFPANRVPTG